MRVTRLEVVIPRWARIEVVSRALGESLTSCVRGNYTTNLSMLYLRFVRQPPHFKGFSSSGSRRLNAQGRLNSL